MKRAVLEALLSGDFQVHLRKDVEEKNLLAIGAVSPSLIAEVIKSSKGSDYACSPLYGKPWLDCHVIRSRGWYVKFYFLDPGTVFISVHK